MKLNPVVRATGIICLTAALVTGVTFAALSSSAPLTNNTLASATANLEVDSQNDGFATTDPGFTFTGIVPGGVGSGDSSFKLNNAGSTDLEISVNLDAAPVWTVVPASSVDDTKVHVTFTCEDGDLTPYTVTTTVANLVAGPVSLVGDNLAIGQTANCTVSVSMDAGAFTGSSASSDTFDFVFTGTGV